MSRWTTGTRYAVRGAALWLPLLLGLMGSRGHAQTSGLPAPMSGDCTVSAAGVATCSKTNGNAFAASATVDATNAGNISSGLLAAARMCSGTASAGFYCDKNSGAWQGVAAVPAGFNGLRWGSTGAADAAATPLQIASAANNGNAPTTNGVSYWDGSKLTNGSSLTWNGSQLSTSISSQAVGISATSSNAGGSTIVSIGTNSVGETNFVAQNNLGVGTAIGTEGSGRAPFGIIQAGHGMVYTFAPALDIVASSTSGVINFGTGGTGGVNRMSISTSAITASLPVTATQVTASTSSAAGFHEVLFTPSSSSATCSAGDFTDDANYHYVCTSANTWKRVALSAF